MPMSRHDDDDDYYYIAIYISNMNQKCKNVISFMECRGDIIGSQ